MISSDHTCYCSGVLASAMTEFWIQTTQIPLSSVLEQLVFRFITMSAKTRYFVHSREGRIQSTTFNLFSSRQCVPQQDVQKENTCSWVHSGSKNSSKLLSYSKLFVSHEHIEIITGLIMFFDLPLHFRHFTCVVFNAI
jgi:hypothetical protein